MTTKTEPAKKMLADLRQGDRIQFSLAELRLGLPSSTLVDREVVTVRKLPEGWHQVETTDYGVLSSQNPTYKYSVIQ